MDKEREWKELKTTIVIFVIWIVNSLMDGAFIIFWVAVQYIVNRVVNALQLSGIDRVVFYIFQFLLAISTLFPVALTIYKDIRIMAIRTNRKIQYEIKIGEGNGSEKS
jgi:hypothetical protein